jgi:hypothetical protein
MATGTRTYPAKAAPAKVLSLEMTAEEVLQLKKREPVSLSRRSLSEMASFLKELDKKLIAAGTTITWGELTSHSGKCRGIEVISTTEDCGWYWRFPMILEECCRE